MGSGKNMRFHSQFASYSLYSQEKNVAGRVKRRALSSVGLLEELARLAQHLLALSDQAPQAPRAPVAVLHAPNLHRLLVLLRGAHHLPGQAAELLHEPFLLPLQVRRRPRPPPRPGPASAPAGRASGRRAPPWPPGAGPAGRGAAAAGTCAPW